MGNERLAAHIAFMHMEALARHPKLWYRRLEESLLPGMGALEDEYLKTGNLELLTRLWMPDVKIVTLSNTYIAGPQ